ncbi:MAG: DUF427 domain-containing protein [Intrasporangiaceae bacterium]|nr:DUF427 domain-containing protein [Intrasporangiaceae bacterium]
MRAIWNDTLLAESDHTVVVEGNHYFPPDSVRWQHLADSDTRTVCHWKGTATYYTIRADGGENPDAAWSYPAPSPAAEGITGHVAFWRGVAVTE